MTIELVYVQLWIVGWWVTWIFAREWSISHFQYFFQSAPVCSGNYYFSVQETVYEYVFLATIRSGIHGSPKGIPFARGERWSDEKNVDGAWYEQIREICRKIFLREREAGRKKIFLKKS